jgi:hypothetical protein
MFVSLIVNGWDTFLLHSHAPQVLGLRHFVYTQSAACASTHACMMWFSSSEAISG